MTSPYPFPYRAPYCSLNPPSLPFPYRAPHCSRGSRCDATRAVREAVGGTVAGGRGAGRLRCGDTNALWNSWLRPPPFRTKWTRRVPHPVLIGHVSSLTPYSIQMPYGIHARGRPREGQRPPATRARDRTPEPETTANPRTKPRACEQRTNPLPHTSPTWVEYDGRPSGGGPATTRAAGRACGRSHTLSAGRAAARCATNTPAEGRGVSDQYGVTDAACPISTG